MTKRNKTYSSISYLLSGLTFIPYLGFLFAPVIIVWGVIRSGKAGQILTSIGFCGLFFSWGSALHMDHIHSLKQDNLHFDNHVNYIISDFVHPIERFKIVEGFYPTSLEVFLGQDDDIRLDQYTIRRLFYKVTEEGSHYFLLGVGADNTPFTSDDILPEVDQADSVKTGLIIKDEFEITF